MTPRRIWTLGASMLALAPPAHAHLVSTDLGPIYDSALHFLTNPEDLVPMWGLAVLAGFQGATQARWQLFSVTLAWVLGSTGALVLHLGAGLSLWPAAASLLIGGLLAADVALPSMWLAALSATIGLIGGAHSVVSLSPLRPIASLLAVSAALFVTTAIISSLIVPLRAPWIRLLVRVAGSWLAALGVLLIGWFIHAK